MFKNPEDKKKYDKEYQRKNQPRIRIYLNGWEKRNQEKKWGYKLKYRYGITPEDYRRMFKEQNEVCAICKNKETMVDRRNGKTRILSVDHCHKTGKVRGLLCYYCNNILGSADDKIEILNNCIKYLEGV